MANASARLLIVLTSREPQTALALAKRAKLAPSEALRALQQLVVHGFIVADTGAEIAVYRLVPRDEPLTTLPPNQRVLIVDDDEAIRNLMVDVLEEEQYAVIAAETVLTAHQLLEQVY